MPHISAPDLLDTARRALAGAGANDTMARLTAQALVQADLQGLASHGVTRIPAYTAHLRNGRADGSAEPLVLREHGAVLLIDARQGLAYPACQLAVQRGIALARQQASAGTLGEQHVASSTRRAARAARARAARGPLRHGRADAAGWADRSAIRL